MKAAFGAAMLAVATTGASALSLYQFPDCKHGPLAGKKICDESVNYYERAQSLVQMFTLDELIANTVNNASGVPRLDIAPRNWWSEALHGVASSPGVTFASGEGKDFANATSFPDVISLAASFDTDMYKQIGQVIKKEVRAFNNAGRSGINLYSPANINAFRDPRWGRGQETVGEDVLHISAFTRALFAGAQGEHPEKLDLLVCAKHYLGYDIDSNPDRYGFDAQISTQDLAEFYLPQFKAAVRDAKAASLMTSYNAVNGVAPSASKYYLQTLARDTWGLDKLHNYVTSDCDAIEDVYSPLGFAKSPVEAVAMTIEAGVDLNCGKYYSEYLKEAIAKNLTSRATVERSVTRMYASLVRLGVFDDPAKQPLRKLTYKDVNTKDAQNLAYEAAVASMTVLKNDGILPASPSKYKKIALIGPFTDTTNALSGNYAGPGPYAITIHQGLEGTYQMVNTSFGTGINDPLTDGFPDALAAARAADLIVYAGGIDSSVEFEGMDRYSLEYTHNQPDLIKQLAMTGKPLVVLQAGGGQVDNSQFKNNKGVNAIMWIGYPGQAAGWAVADIISGKRSPSGRLPVTQYPAGYINAVNKTDMAVRPSATNAGRTYQWYTGEAVYPFGHGLHYTNFSASLAGDAGKSFNIQQILSSNSSMYKDRIQFGTVKAQVKNTGKVTSDYAALLYSNSTNGPQPYPLRKLVSYTKVHNLGGGKSHTANLPLTVDAFARIEQNGDMALYPGTYNLMFDNWDAPLATATITLTGDREVVEAWPQPN